MRSMLNEMQTIPTVTFRKDDHVAFAALLINGQAFNTHGYLKARRGFCGFGAFVPFDEVEREEVVQAQYVVYSYDTPIAWRDQNGEWHMNFAAYSATTSKHQSKIFDALAQL